MKWIVPEMDSNKWDKHNKYTQIQQLRKLSKPPYDNFACC